MNTSVCARMLSDGLTPSKDWKSVCIHTDVHRKNRNIVFVDLTVPSETRSTRNDLIKPESVRLMSCFNNPAVHWSKHASVSPNRIFRGGVLAL